MVPHVLKTQPLIVSLTLLSGAHSLWSSSDAICASVQPFEELGLCLNTKIWGFATTWFMDVLYSLDLLDFKIQRVYVCLGAIPFEDVWIQHQI